jgi:hypothetical protein
MGTLDGAPASIPFKEVEDMRKAINQRIANASGEDVALLPRIKREFDGWLDDVVDRGLIEGEPAFLDAFKQARELAYDYSRSFRQDGARDSTGRIMEGLSRYAETPEQAVNYLFGQSALGNARQSAGAVKILREKLPPEDFAAVKELAWIRLSRDKKGQPLSADKFDTQWKTFLNQNKSLANELFNETELRLMHQYKLALEATKASPTNTSGTADALENAWRQTLRAFGSRERITGNPLTGLALTFASRLPVNPFELTSGVQRRQALRHISPPPTPAPYTPVPAGGAALGREQGLGLLEDYLNGGPQQ